MYGICVQTNKFFFLREQGQSAKPNIKTINRPRNIHCAYYLRISVCGFARMDIDKNIFYHVRDISVYFILAWIFRIKKNVNTYIIIDISIYFSYTYIF